MASDESMSIPSCISMQEDEYDNDSDDGYGHDHDHHDHTHHHNLSRLSMCTNSSIYGADHDHHSDEDEDHDRSYFYQGQAASQKEKNGMSTYMSLLSIESFDGDVDEEEEEEERPNHQEAVVAAAGLSSDSDREPGSYSLPATPLRRRRAQMLLDYNHDPNPMVVKEYASENEAHDPIKAQNQVVFSDDHYSKSRRTRRRRRSSWLSSPISDDRGVAAIKKKLDDEDKSNSMSTSTMMRLGSSSTTTTFGHCQSLSGDSDDHDHDHEGTSSTGGGRGGVVMITRPKGGRRSLCMDLEEVKACRDLGFELEHQRMVQQDINRPSRLSLSLSASTIDTNYTTSSGGNSPIANQRISSPGDDPREVKARLKVWAQAVALASASRQCS